MKTFSSVENRSASELRSALGQWGPPKDPAEAISELTAAIMILCTEVDCLKGELDNLREEVNSLYGEGSEG